MEVSLLRGDYTSRYTSEDDDNAFWRHYPRVSGPVTGVWGRLRVCRECQDVRSTEERCPKSYGTLEAASNCDDTRSEEMNVPKPNGVSRTCNRVVRNTAVFPTAPGGTDLVRIFVPLFRNTSPSADVETSWAARGRYPPPPAVLLNPSSGFRASEWKAKGAKEGNVSKWSVRDTCRRPEVW